MGVVVGVDVNVVFSIALQWRKRFGRVAVEGR